MAAEFRILRTLRNSVLSGIVERAAPSYILHSRDAVLSPYSFNAMKASMDPEFRSHCHDLIRRVVHLKDCL